MRSEQLVTSVFVYIEVKKYLFFKSYHRLVTATREFFYKTEIHRANILISIGLVFLPAKMNSNLLEYFSS